jgi:hypothetical protein
LHATVSLVHKLVKYVFLVIELAQACKYGQISHMQVYSLTTWHARLAGAHLSAVEALCT